MTLLVRVQASPGAALADYPLDGNEAGEIIIGRAGTAAIVIPDALVSRHHARLVRRDQAWWIEDLGARNRTLLNGAPIVQPERLRAGDRLEVGEAVLRLVDDSSEQRSTTVRGVHDAARMWTVNEIHRALAGPLGLAELLEVILARCFDVLNPEEGLIMLRGPDGALAPAASRRRDGSRETVTLPRRLVDEVAGKGQPALVLDAAYDERFAGSASMVSSGMRSVVAAPIVDAEGTLGLITLSSRLAVRQFAQADLDMLVTIASAAALRVRNAAMADELAARRVVEHELELAHDVQMAMLPRTMPQFPGLALAATLQPARSVGGDLYDVVLDGTRLWFIVADVAGKSIAAALYMAITRALFRATVRGAGSVAAVASRMNAELAHENERVMFVTAVLGCLDLSNATVALIDAGHNPALLVDDSGVREAASVPKGIAFGAVESAQYEEGTFALPPSATLLLYTDGITDARGASDEMFGERRLHDVLRGAAAKPVGGLMSDVIAAVEGFAAGAPPDDDLTLLALRYARS